MICKPVRDAVVKKIAACWGVVFLFLSFAATSYGDGDPAHAAEIQVKQAGVSFTLIAEHPKVVTPTGVDVDQQGRVWLISSHTHHRPADYQGPELDEILVFDPDGTRHVFYNKTSQTMDLELGQDGWVYLAERSRIFRIKDTDSDGKADVEEPLFTMHTEAVYPHNGLAGLAWDLEGNFLFGLGENHSESWELSAPDGTVLRGNGEGGIFRCRPDFTGLKQISRGLWNPFGICVRTDGEIFAVDNDPGERPPCRLLHIVEDSDYGYRRFYGGAAHHPFVGWNGELRGTLPMVHPSGEAPCGVAQLGQGVLIPSWSEHRIQFMTLSPQGASFTASNIELIHGGRYFRPTCIAPSTAETTNTHKVWYLTDWVDGRYDVHGYGRLWKLEINVEQADWLGPLELPERPALAEQALKIRQGKDLLSEQQLFSLAENSDPYVAQAALVGLARKVPGWTIQSVEKLPSHQRLLAFLAVKMAATPSYQMTPPTFSTHDFLKTFVKNEHPAIQFESLRWISDSGLKDFQADVDEILSSKTLSFEMFEAAVATWNSLNGQSEQGLRNPELLLSQVENKDASPALRAFALRMLPPKSKGLTTDTLQELLGTGDETLSLEVVRTAVGNPAIGIPILRNIAADTNASEQLRVEAVSGLSVQATEHLDLLLGLAEGESPALREEALRALRGTPLPETATVRLLKIKQADAASAELVDAAVNVESLTLGRPAIEETELWLKQLEAVPGAPDIERGRRIFAHARIGLCQGCHRHSGRGNVVGPDLTQVGLQSQRKQLLESILQPSKNMAPQYQPSLILLQDGRVVTGIRLRSWVKETIRNTKGENETYDRDDVEEIHPLSKSFMPEGLANLMTLTELRDLLEFLAASGVQEELTD